MEACGRSTHSRYRDTLCEKNVNYLMYLYVDKSENDDNDP